jgi:hypothetical protein
MDANAARIPAIHDQIQIPVVVEVFRRYFMWVRSGVGAKR